MIVTRVQEDAAQDELPAVHTELHTPPQFCAHCAALGWLKTSTMTVQTSTVLAHSTWHYDPPSVVVVEDVAVVVVVELHSGEQ